MKPVVKRIVAVCCIAGILAMIPVTIGVAGKTYHEDLKKSDELTKAITANDYNVVLALTFVFAFIFIAARLLLDVLYGIIDPRIRVSGKG